MVQDKPYVHWKIKNAVDLTEIDPVYLWGTVIESNKGPIDEPVFITKPDQAKKIFNYNLDPFFANGGRYAVVIRAYGGTPQKSSFDITLDEDFAYAYVDYDYYDNAHTAIKAVVKIKTGTLDNERPSVVRGEEAGQEEPVTFFEGRWRLCDNNGVIKYFYKEEVNNETVIKEAAYINGNYYKNGTATTATAEELEAAALDMSKAFTKGFNESDVRKITIARIETITAGTPVINVESIYEGDFLIPISVQRDIREGYRVSITESDDYTIMLSGATTLEYIVKRINERATNVVASLTSEGEKVQKVFSSSLVPAVDLPEASEANVASYTAAVGKNPVGAIFAKPNNNKYAIILTETVSYLADGSNGQWDSNLGRIPESDRLQAHQNALDFLANIKLAGIFCNYGEDELQKVYADHVSTTEPQGMNSTEVCKWRTLIVGANALDRTNDPGEEPGFKLADKAIAFDNENIIFLGQGLIDDGYVPASNVKEVDGQYVSLLNEDSGASQYQLLPFQCTQYIAGLRSKLFYGDAIFGGEAKKEIQGVGNMTIAPLFADQNKLLWQPDAYAYLNEHGVLTFTEDYNILSLTDGVTTRQNPLEEDEEGVQSIIKYAKHAVHEILQTYIGRNITGDLQIAMENAVRSILSGMQTQDQTLMAVDGYDAFDIDIVLVPKSNAKQILAKAYVYLKLTPVHALRQIEVELTVQ